MNLIFALKTAHMALGRIVDGLISVSVDGYLHGQDDVGDMYLGPWHLGEALCRTGSVRRCN
jgi:hypothetical protein